MPTRNQTMLPVLVAAATLWAMPSLAGKEDDTLRWASDSEPSNVAWYQHTLREGIVIGQHVWDTLLYRNPATAEYEPHLATSVEYVNPTTIDVELRKDVTFHNGEKFDADDVVYTINWVTDPKSRVVAQNRVSFLKGAEKIDQYNARIFLKEPFPAAMDYLAVAVMMYPNEYHAEVGPAGMGRKPVGTGPYRVTEVSPGERIVLEKYEDYFGGAKGQPSIGTLEFRRIGELNTQMAELLTGGLDWIWRMPPDQAKLLEGREGVTVKSGETMRIGFVYMDAAGRSGDTPFTKAKVRKAVSYAIDREGIRKAFMGGDSRVIHVVCFPSQVGCIDDGAPRYEYDPERAKQLLGEAGYPDGFETTFYAYRERPIAEAIIGNLREIGIDANLQFMQAGALREMRRRGEVPINFQAWGSSSVNDVTASTGNFFTHGPDDYARDPDVLRLMEEGNTTDKQVRKKAYEQALTRIAEQAYALPLFSYTLFYAYTDELTFTPSFDEIPRFFNARWKEGE